MGTSKALLPFGDEALLQRVVRLIAPAVSHFAVVAAPEQDLPALPSTVVVVRDPVEGEGPLRGIAVGLEALARQAPFAYVTATDAPFVSPAFVARMHALCDGDIAVPLIDGRFHPLAAIYATSLHALAAELLAAGQRRPISLFDRATTRVVTAADLFADEAVRRDDPDLATLKNLNTPEDYRAALAAVGLAP
jgi:molybdopterin-guanine dinucleotide biosynthesis protein A